MQPDELTGRQQNSEATLIGYLMASLEKQVSVSVNSSRLHSRHFRNELPSVERSATNYPDQFRLEGEQSSSLMRKRNSARQHSLEASYRRSSASARGAFRTIKGAKIKKIITVRKLADVRDVGLDSQLFRPAVFFTIIRRASACGIN